ncbi:MAG: hypothetical protein WDO69_33625 [Pseudomonadota bacterium]
MIASAAGVFGESLETFATLIDERGIQQGQDKVLQAYVLSTVVNSVCWVEGAAQELFEMCGRASDPRVQSLDPARRAKVARLKPPAPTIKKWETLIAELTGTPLNDTAPAVSEMQLLLWLRNLCVHAEPWHLPSKKGRPEDVEAALRSKFTLNEFPGEAKTFFPHIVLSRGCAAWSFSTARQFNRYALDQLGLGSLFGA